MDLFNFFYKENKENVNLLIVYVLWFKVIIKKKYIVGRNKFWVLCIVIWDDVLFYL